MHVHVSCYTTQCYNAGTDQGDTTLYHLAWQRSAFFGHVTMLDVTMDHSRALWTVMRGLSSHWKCLLANVDIYWMYTMKTWVCSASACTLHGNKHGTVNSDNELWKQLWDLLLIDTLWCHIAVGCAAKADACIKGGTGIGEWPFQTLHGETSFHWPTMCSIPWYVASQCTWCKTELSLLGSLKCLLLSFTCWWKASMDH